jgi:hypothetical protein
MKNKAHAVQSILAVTENWAMACKIPVHFPMRIRCRISETKSPCSRHVWKSLAARMRLCFP